MKTITLTLALGAVLALSAALPAAAAGNNGGSNGFFGEQMTRGGCEDIGGDWIVQPPGSAISVCVIEGGAFVCDSNGRDCVFDTAYRNAVRGRQVPATAGVATAPESPRRGFQVQPMFPAVGSFRIR